MWLPDWAWLIWLILWLWHRLPFRVTAGWLGLGTVAVAVIAIFVNSTYSRRTLETSAGQFQRGRIDARTDKLRAEIAALISELINRERMRDIMLPLADAEVNALDITQQANLVVTHLVESTGTVQGVYLNAVGHTLAIRMLTADETIVRLADQIGQVAAAELGDIRRTLDIVTVFRRSHSANAFHEDAKDRRAERNEREEHLTRLVTELVNYGVITLRQL